MEDPSVSASDDHVKEVLGLRGVSLAVLGDRSHRDKLADALGVDLDDPTGLGMPEQEVVAGFNSSIGDSDPHEAQ